MSDFTIGFIGFGLIAGSLARSMKEIYPNYKLYAYDYGNHNDKDTPNGLTLALADHVLDCTFSSLEDFSVCDIIFLCAPVRNNTSYLPLLKNIMKPSCILTDVGSVKGNIHKAVAYYQLEDNFIGGHPMAGSEKTGYENSSSKLFENAYYILTPSEKTDPASLNFLTKLIKDIGAIPIVLDYKEHDNITAAISHVPHIIAASLVNLVKSSDDEDEKMRTLAAGGFKDITRIASSSPIMWQNICLSNRESIKHFLENYITSLEDIKAAITRQDEEYLYQIFDTANEYRRSIPNSSKGLMEKVYEIFIDIIDEAGAIATIATLLATNMINIKNIGIIHNREFAEGVLRIEFYEDVAKERAIELLNKYRYTVYDR